MNFLFGQPVIPARPTATGQTDLFVLGAYPSALHVRWDLPKEYAMSIRAIAVDNEPEPFWTGHDEQERIESWKRMINFRPEWGTISHCHNLNGPSGFWVEDKILKPLGVARSTAWITDCIDTYYESPGAAHRLDAPDMIKAIRELGIPERHLLPHPSEGDIVRISIAEHRTRLLRELKTALPTRIVTLGNAALRVLNSLADTQSNRMQKLSLDGYGTPLTIRIGGREMEWLPLAHPAAPPKYQLAHNIWTAHRI